MTFSNFQCLDRTNRVAKAVQPFSAEKRAAFVVMFMKTIRSCWKSFPERLYGAPAYLWGLGGGPLLPIEGIFFYIVHTGNNNDIGFYIPTKNVACQCHNRDISPPSGGMVLSGCLFRKHRFHHSACYFWLVVVCCKFWLCWGIRATWHVLVGKAGFTRTDIVAVTRRYRLGNEPIPS